MKIKYLFVMSALLWPAAFAGPGHDHGEVSSAAAKEPAAPRFSTHSENFEVVGTVDGPHLDVYVDRFADNSAVLDAKIEIESGKVKLAGKFIKEDGSYEFESAAFKTSGTYPIVVTISDGKTTDILASELVVGSIDAAHHDGVLHKLEAVLASPRLMTAIVGGVALAFGALAWFMRNRRTAKGGLQ